MTLLFFILTFYSFQNQWVEVHDNNELILTRSTVVNCQNEIGFNTKDVLLSFKNTSSENYEGNYYIKLYYEDSCINCLNLKEYTYPLFLGPGEEISGSCNAFDYSKRIFIQFTEGQDQKKFLSKFEVVFIN